MRTCLARYLPVGLVAVTVVVFGSARVFNQPALRNVTIDTREVTQPDVSASADGRFVVFTAVGHVFRVPAEGGAATQLTFGPSYDNDPVVSPDGTRVAFLSDRDGSASNVFVVDVRSRQVRQITHEVQAELPAWSPDGSTIAYARVLRREEYPAAQIPQFGDGGLREIRTIPSRGGPVTVIASPAGIGTVFYLPDGRLGWTAPEPPPGGGGMFAVSRQTLVLMRAADGRVTTAGTLPGNPGRALPGPSGQSLLYASGGGIQEWPLAGGTPAKVATLGPGAGRFGVAPATRMAYYGADGRVWRVALGAGEPSALPLTLHATLDVEPRVIPRWTPSVSTAPQAIVNPQISRDGRRLVFMAAGFIWEQGLPGGTARRISADTAFERDPAISPDGRLLAYAASRGGVRELRVYDFVSRQTRVLQTVEGASWLLFPSWKPDGTAIVVQRSDLIGQPYRILEIALDGGTARELAETRNDWSARPQFTADGQAIYFTARAQKVAALYRLALSLGAAPTAVTDLSRHVHEGLVSPDGRWFAFRRNSEIWIAPMTGRVIGDRDIRRFSSEGGRSFAFLPDSSAIVYSGGGRAWRQPVRTGDRVAVPVRVTLPRQVAPPTLVRRVRVADLQAPRVGNETSILVQDGRVQWIGREADHQIPAGAAVVDAGGRIAIPGLFDLHVHAGWENQQASEDVFIAYGITSVRDTGSGIDVMGALDDRSRTTSLPAPRYFYSGEIFEGAMPMWGDAFLQVANAQEAREHVRRWKAWGADFIKVYSTMPWDLQRVVADEAHRVGLPVVGHGLSVDEIVRRAVRGYSSVEHAPGAMGDDVRQLLAKTGTRWDPTLTIWGGHTLIMREHPERLGDPTLLAFVPEAMRKAAPTGGLTGRMADAAIRAQWAGRLALVRAAHADGVPLGAGTDSLMSGTLWGQSTHWELEHFVEAGFTPAEALRLATADAAAMVGASADLGTVAPGKLADFVLLDANPLDDVRNAERIWRVFKGGHLFDPATLRTSR